MIVLHLELLGTVPQCSEKREREREREGRGVHCKNQQIHEERDFYQCTHLEMLFTECDWLLIITQPNIVLQIQNMCTVYAFIPFL